jgi:hypothetical protein
MDYPEVKNPACTDDPVPSSGLRVVLSLTDNGTTLRVVVRPGWKPEIVVERRAADAMGADCWVPFRVACTGDPIFHRAALACVRADPDASERILRYLLEYVG